MGDHRPQRIRELFHAALGHAPETRDGFLRQAAGDDTALAAAVAELLHLHDHAQPDEPDAVPDDFVGARVGPYDVLRLIGVGGMGRVYLARRADGAFDRLVAVKAMDPDVVDSDAVARFEQERRILARLRHPCIAELIDAGRTDRNELYFVMEYVDGVPITRFCDDRALPIRERVVLFRRVCDAVSEAHRNLIVHRDLKPGNILVDGSGTPKLLDFGIAKPITPVGLEASDSTDPRHRRGTPGYASPEHVQGEAAHVGMDVFSLGVVLHELVTGCSPVLPAPGAPTESHGAGFLKPSAIVAGGAGGELSGDLDAVILKCLEGDRRRRYRSVDQLSEDLLAWLAGRPVAARPIGRWERGYRAVRRNRAVSLAGAVAVIAVIGAAVGFAQLWRASVREREREADLVRRARTLADATFDLDRWLRDLPGSTAARQQLVGALGAHLSGLAVEGDTSLALETAEGYRRLGDIWGGPGGPNLGNAVRARESYASALTILGTLAPTGADATRVMTGLARTHASLADVLADQGDTDGAGQHYAQALQLADELCAEDPDDVRYQILAAGVRRPLSDLKLASGDIDGALAEIDRALAIDTANARRFDTDPEHHRLLVLDYVRLARIHAERGAFDDAANSHRQAEAEIARVAVLGGETASVRRDAAVGRARLAAALHASGRRAAGLAALRSAVDELRALTQADVADARAGRDLMASLVQLADMLWMDDRGGARGALEEARHIALALTAGQPDGSRAAADLELVDQRLSGLARGLGNADLRLFRVEHGRRIPLGPRDQPAVRATIAAVTRTPPGWTDYLLVFGAEGPAQLLDRSSAADREWTLTAAGPPPTQTVVLISLPAPLSDAAKRQLLADVAAVGDRRVVEADEHVSWAFNEPRVESTASPRGARRIGWVEAVRDRLAGLGTLAVAGHTFSLRVGLGSRPGP